MALPPSFPTALLYSFLPSIPYGFDFSAKNAFMAPATCKPCNKQQLFGLAICLPPAYLWWMPVLLKRKIFPNDNQLPITHLVP
jgi:hypothetical protein